MIIYLATPFSNYPDHDKRISEIRTKLASLIRSHPKAVFVSAIFYYPLVVDLCPNLKEPPFDWWYETSIKLVEKSDLLYLWNPDNVKSSGTDLELRIARENSIPIIDISHKLDLVNLTKMFESAPDCIDVSGDVNFRG